MKEPTPAVAELTSMIRFPISFFFFSSRRRHTRYWRDWSSDVCSSDLPLLILCNHSQFNEPRERPNVFAGCMVGMSPRIQTRRCLRKTSQENCFAQSEIRSEERRVGKEGKTRWWQCHEETNAMMRVLEE